MSVVIKEGGCYVYRNGQPTGPAIFVAEQYGSDEDSWFRFKNNPFLYSSDPVTGPYPFGLDSVDGYDVVDYVN